MLSLIACSGQSFPEAKKDSIKRAISYGSQALDLLDISDRQLRNAKVEIKQYQGIFESKTFESEWMEKSRLELLKALEYELNKKPEFRDLPFFTKVWAYMKGIIIGGLIATGILITQ